MTDSLTMALAQINPTVGDIDGNANRIVEARAVAAKQGADLVVTGELALSGYPPEDLVLKPAFQDTIEAGSSYGPVHLASKLVSEFCQRRN